MPSRPTFIVIGAQKSATTSLYHWLRVHPEIYLSQQKELNFFSQSELYERGLEYYCEHWFANTGAAKAIGDVSPDYMLSSLVPARLANDLPGVQLVAVLRNPIDRAVSHYLMIKKRGQESRSFEAVADELRRGERKLIAEAHSNYLIGGLYGLTLGKFLQHYPRHSLHVIFYEELIADPAGSLSSLYEFLGVDARFRPPDLSTAYNRRASTSRFPAFETWMMRQAALKRLIKAVIPHALLSRFLFWFDTEFNVRREVTDDDVVLEEPLRERLREYFRPDVQQIQQLIGRSVPWREFAGTSAGTSCSN